MNDDDYLEDGDGGGGIDRMGWYDVEGRTDLPRIDKFIFFPLERSRVCIKLLPSSMVR